MGLNTNPKPLGLRSRGLRGLNTNPEPLGLRVQEPVSFISAKFMRAKNCFSLGYGLRVEGLGYRMRASASVRFRGHREMEELCPGERRGKQQETLYGEDARLCRVQGYLAHKKTSNP